MNMLILRLEAPLMSFGGVMVDQHNGTERFPGRGMLAGLIANALGWHHGDGERINELQTRLEFAARWDVKPRRLRDYHTVDMGQSHLREPGWTTGGIPEHREGGLAARYGTHQRYRHYLADGVMTLVLAISDGNPGLDDIESALARPARPLFLGRKNCLPAAPILLGRRDASDLLSALIAEPAHPRRRSSGPFPACWPPGLEHANVGGSRQRLRTDDRDWINQVVSGMRPVMEGIIEEIADAHA